MSPRQTFRALLFAPGSRPERFEKALAAGADAVCLDLEDAVPPAGKGEARAAVAEALKTPRPGLGVRINGVASEHFSADAHALASLHPAFVMVPKVEAAEQLSEVRARLRGDPVLWPIVESPEGLRQAWEIAAAPGVGGVLFGAADFAAEVGCTLDWDALLYARGALAVAAARAGVELMDTPHFDVGDLADLEISTVRARAMGFTGRACIHPAQVGPVMAAYTPTAAEADRARRVVEAFEASDGGAALLDGRLIELPVVRAARRVLAHIGG